MCMQRTFDVQPSSQNEDKGQGDFCSELISRRAVQRRPRRYYCTQAYMFQQKVLRRFNYTCQSTESHLVYNSFSYRILYMCLCNETFSIFVLMNIYSCYTDVPLMCGAVRRHRPQTPPDFLCWDLLPVYKIQQSLSLNILWA